MSDMTQMSIIDRGDITYSTTVSIENDDIIINPRFSSDIYDILIRAMGSSANVIFNGNWMFLPIRSKVKTVTYQQIHFTGNPILLIAETAKNVSDTINFIDCGSIDSPGYQVISSYINSLSEPKPKLIWK